MSHHWTRRAAMTGAGAAILGGGFLIARKADHGGRHSQYFEALSDALKRAEVAQPALIVDAQRLQENINAVRGTLSRTPLKLRVVVKSLPAAQLIERIATALETERYMVFNGPMLTEMSARQPQADLLLGKPLPVAAAEHFYRAMAKRGSFADPQWLIDSSDRLGQYEQLARKLSRKLRVNLEIDVGLHRGGFADAESLRATIAHAKQSSDVLVTGLMGYDAHVPKVPGSESAYKQSQEQYASAIQALKGELPGTEFTYNAAGSPTYSLHAKQTVANEVSVGSAFVKPTDFDIDTLAAHIPAAFIATPVIKSLPHAQVPGLEFLTGARRLWDANAEQAFFIHGGHWLAKPESPPGLQYSDLYGRSSNQELLTGSKSIALKPDDFIFLRPTQSEAVFLQFGDILVYDGKEIVERWPTFAVSA